MGLGLGKERAQGRADGRVLTRSNDAATVAEVQAGATLRKHHEGGDCLRVGGLHHDAKDRRVLRPWRQPQVGGGTRQRELAQLPYSVLRFLLWLAPRP